MLGNFVAQRARKNIDGTAGGIGHQDVHGLGGISGLRRSRA